jgi:hypothetical protein
MKKTLSEIFKGRCVTGEIPDDARGYYWYFNEENEPIGISKEISRTERDLIELNYVSIGVNKLTDTEKLLWMNFLTSNETSTKIPEVRTGTTLMSFIFFYHDFDTELQKEFESLVGSFRDDFKVLFLDAEYGVILDFSIGGADDYAEVDDFLLASKQDFSAHLVFYRTIYYEINKLLPHKFGYELVLFKDYKDENTDLMRYTDMFLNYMVSSDVVAEHVVFNDWFKSLFVVDTELLSVVKCYLENGFNITTGAKVLHMHRNTFMNKLDRFILETGLDIKKFDEAAIVYLLIRHTNSHLKGCIGIEGV